MTLEQLLENIAFQLERIADGLQTPIQTPTATMEPELKPMVIAPILFDNRGRPKGTIPKCSRCRRDGRSISPKRNGRCIECEFEEWWTE